MVKVEKYIEYKIRTRVLVLTPEGLYINNKGLFYIKELQICLYIFYPGSFPNATALVIYIVRTRWWNEENQ